MLIYIIGAMLVMLLALEIQRGKNMGAKWILIIFLLWVLVVALIKL